MLGRDLAQLDVLGGLLVDHAEPLLGRGEAQGEPVVTVELEALEELLDHQEVLGAALAQVDPAVQEAQLGILLVDRQALQRLGLRAREIVVLVVGERGLAVELQLGLGIDFGLRAAVAGGREAGDERQS